MLLKVAFALDLVSGGADLYNATPVTERAINVRGGVSLIRMSKNKIFQSKPLYRDRFGGVLGVIISRSR